MIMDLNQNKYMKLILLPLFWLACTTADLPEKAVITETQSKVVESLPDDIIPLNLFFHFN